MQSGRRKIWLRGVLALIFIAMLLLSVVNSLNAEKYTEREVNRAYTSHAPIRIDANSEFNAAHGVVGGSGTADDPFVISGWEIDAGGLGGAGVAIYIGNTTAYFVIENCKLYNSTHYGIEFYNVKNGMVRDVEIDGRYAYGMNEGIYIHYCDNITVEKNNITYLDYDGILMEYSSHIFVGNNTIYYGDYTGMASVHTSNSTFYGNMIIDCGHGDLSACGICLAQSSENITVKRNSIVNSTYGISIYDGCKNNRIYENFVAQCYYYGIATSGNYTYISGNLLYYNYGTGDYYDTTNPSQGYDNGYNNHWYVPPYPALGVGNYWREWANNNNSNDQDYNGIVDYSYKIDGGAAGVFDKDPLKYTVPTPTRNLTAVAGAGFVNLTWDPPLGDSGKEITEYRIYRNGTLIATVPATQLWYNDTSVSGGVTYEYYVTAVNYAGESYFHGAYVKATPSQPVPEISMNMLMFTIILAGMMYCIVHKGKKGNRVRR